MNALWLIHYAVIAATTFLTGLGVCLGQGYACQGALDALNRQPAAQADIMRTLFLALALIETAALLGLLWSLLLFFQPTHTLAQALAQMGIGCALAIPGLVIGIAASFPARQAFYSIARNPFLGKKITNIMLLTQSLIQTPLVFGFIISFLIRNQLTHVSTTAQAICLIASGLCLGLGSIGPALGSGKFTQAACYSAGINPETYGQILSFTVISQAIIETPVIFASIVAFWMSQITAATSTLMSIIYLMIAFVMGIGTFAPGLSSGKIAATACKEIAFKPHLYELLSRTSMIAQGLIDTSAIYAFIVALFLLLRF